MSEWQTIETAPTDGVYVLLCCDFGEGRREITVARWCDSPAPAGPFGRFMWRELQDSSIAENVPTHWMPLPALPCSVEQLSSEKAK
jgi:hypothetical protein